MLVPNVAGRLNLAEGDGRTMLVPSVAGRQSRTGREG